MSQDWRAKAKSFLSESQHFQLGELPTEQPHPKTVGLAELARTDLSAALQILQEVDQDAIALLLKKIADLDQLQVAIRHCLKNGGRIFLCGCGATGRLALALEVLWREQAPPLQRDHVVSFMAGGDYALVRSIENFEDFPEYGAQQLLDLGFGANDLLISCTEGGETPFVIGATEKASEVSLLAPFFLYCNPDDILSRVAERSKRVLENPKIRKIGISVGPMALSGSTRMQASTVLMAAVGAALFSILSEVSVAQELHDFAEDLQKVDFRILAPLIQAEAEIYERGNYLVHSSEEFAITVLTDSTERSPTFSLAPYENMRNPTDRLAWSYLRVPNASHALQGWEIVLKRAPRPLHWPDFKEAYGQNALAGFDFSTHTLTRRQGLQPQAQHHDFSISATGQQLWLQLLDQKVSLTLPATHLRRHLLLKLALNSISTLVMGRLGRFDSNLMLWVKSSNKKLIDRAIRYVQSLAQHREGFKPSYETAALALFEQLDTLKPNEAIVLKTLEKLKMQRTAP